MSPQYRRRLVVVGHGMVGHRFVQAAIERGLTETHDVVVVGEEPRPAYDRVALTSFFEIGADALSLLPDGAYEDPRVELVLGTKVEGLDPDTQTVLLTNGRVLEYDELVLATGAAPFVPPIPGHELPGCFVYRTIEDLEAIREAAASATVGAVVGGGLLGLEAANALAQLGLQTHVVEMAPRLMAVQIDDAGGATLRRHVEGLGLTVHTGAMTTEVLEADGRASGLGLKDAEPIPAEIVVFSAGIRPRDALARAAGLDIAERGGVLVDEQCRTSDERVWAIGECAAPAGRMYGLVAPGYAMAEVVVDALLGGPGSFTGADMSTKLKLLGVDVASFGDAFASTDGALELVFSDAVAGVYKKLVVSEDGTRLLGGVLVGDATAYGVLRPMVSSGIALPDNPEELILPIGRGGTEIGLPDEAQVCSCNDVTKGEICAVARARERPTPSVHPRRLDLRLLQVAGQEDRRGLLRVGRQGRGPQHLRALLAHPTGAVRRRGGARLHEVRPGRRGARPRARLRHLQAGVASDPGLAGRRARARGRHPGPPGHQRRLPRQHPAQRHLLGRAADPGRRDHAGEAHRDRRGRPRLRPLHQDHRRAAHRPVRRPGRRAAGDLAAAGRRRLRVRSRVRQVAAHREVVRRLDLVPLRRAGLSAARDRPRAALPRAALARTS